MSVDVYWSLRAWMYILVSLVLVIVVTLARLYYGYLSSIHVLVVEGYHALLDAATLGLVVAALLVARSEWARRFPYGLYRLEDLAALLIAVAIAYALIEHLGDLWAPIPRLPLEAVVVQAATIPGLAASAWLRARAARLLRSPGLAADAAHMAVDVVESGSVAGGLAAYYALGTPLAYRAAEALALLGLALAAYEAARDSVLALLDLPRDPRLVEEARRLAEKAAGRVASVARLRARWAGPVVFIEVVLRAHPLTTIDVASRAASRVREALRESLEGVEEVVVSIEPIHRDKLVVVLPVEEPGLDSMLSRHFARAPYMLIARVESGRVTSYEVLETSRVARQVDPLLRGAEVAETLHEKGVTDAVVLGIGELAYALLLRHKILVWRGEQRATARENIEMLVKGSLEPLEEPTHEAPWRRRRRG